MDILNGCVECGERRGEERESGLEGGMDEDWMNFFSLWGFLPVCYYYYVQSQEEGSNFTGHSSRKDELLQQVAFR